MGNVGIGTWTASGGSLIVNGGGNVGIGSAWPGALLDVYGYIRSSNNGYIFPDGSIQTTASTGGSAWSISGTNIYTTVGSDNVGIGTSTPQGGFVVTNGNVGIGTWAPAGLLQVNGLANSPMVVTSSGNVGIGTTTPQGGFVVTNGNVGIGTWAPSQSLQVNGNIATTGNGNITTTTTGIMQTNTIYVNGIGGTSGLGQALVNGNITTSLLEVVAFQCQL